MISNTNVIDALVIGAGPAGLMAAQELAKAGQKVLLAEAKPSVGRKLLMAGKSGLNLTKAEEFETFLQAYGESCERLRPILTEFDNTDVQNWARNLGQPVFVGTTGRVFPNTMKSSPLLRAWMGQLSDLGVRLQTRWRWQGWKENKWQFSTPDGPVGIQARITILALGGASWAKLGSDGVWAPLLADKGIELSPFTPANAAIKINWSDHMSRFFGMPVKGAGLTAGKLKSRGEFIISESGLEGGGIYSVSAGIGKTARLHIDLMPDWTVKRITEKLSRIRGKSTVTNQIRKSLKLTPAKLGLLMEFGRPLPVGTELAQLIKSLPVKTAGLAPIDEAISTAGGVAWNAIDNGLMLKALPGVFVAGEMLDWDAPTGGYLLNGCLATGRWAGKSAAYWQH